MFEVMQGEYPNLPKYGGSCVLLYLTLKNAKKKFKKKISEKKLFYFSYKFFIYIFAYIKIFTYLCSTVGVASTSEKDSSPFKSIDDPYRLGDYLVAAT